MPLQISAHAGITAVCIAYHTEETASAYAGIICKRCPLFPLVFTSICVLIRIYSINPSAELFALSEYPLDFQPCLANADNVVSLYHYWPVDPLSIKERTVSGILVFQIKLIVSVNDHTVYL